MKRRRRPKVRARRKARAVRKVQRRRVRRSRPAPPPAPPARPRGEAEPDHWLLLTMLEVAVPLWIHELRKLHPDDRVALAHELANSVAYRGDVLQFRSKTPGATATAFNDTARGLAALAYAPGGVTFCGRHWEAA